jgi:alcohol dehydrogenase
VDGVPVSLPMQEMWIQNVALPMGLADTVSIPTLLKVVASGRIAAEKMGTHSFAFAQMDETYDVFANAAENSALRVVVTRPDPVLPGAASAPPRRCTPLPAPGRPAPA